MAKNCGQRKNYFLDIIHEKSHADWFIDIKEAQKHNLATHSHIPELKIEARVSFKFE